MSAPLKFIDTHTHFDSHEFDVDRLQLAAQAYAVGVEALVLIGYQAEFFPRLLITEQLLNSAPKDRPFSRALLAPGLHPLYINQHNQDDLELLARFIQTNSCVAIGEIGLDTFFPELKTPDIYAKQIVFFESQLELAKQSQLPVLLHIRRSHADTIRLLKKAQFSLGGIVHSFSGGIEEAKQYTKLGFKLGVTGQVTNPNAKRLREVIAKVGAEHVVIETDCPDMTPISCQTSHTHHTRNTPVNLPIVFNGLADILNITSYADKEQLAHLLYKNSHLALKI